MFSQVIADNMKGAAYISEIMQVAAKTDPAIADRCNFYTYRAREEFYDLEKDPHSLKNLINDPQYAKDIAGFRVKLEAWMENRKDPAVEAFRTIVHASL